MANGKTTGLNPERWFQFHCPTLATSFHCALVSSTIKWERKNGILAQSTYILWRWLWDEHINRQIPSQAKTLYCSWKASQHSEYSKSAIALHHSHPANTSFRIVPQIETLLSKWGKTRCSREANLKRRLISVSQLSNNPSYLIIFLYTYLFSPPQHKIGISRIVLIAYFSRLLCD